MIKAATILAGGMPSAVRQWAGPDSSAQAAVAAEDFLSGCYAVDPAAVLSKKARCAHTPTSPSWALIRRLRLVWRGFLARPDCICCRDQIARAAAAFAGQHGCGGCCGGGGRRADNHAGAHDRRPSAGTHRRPPVLVRQSENTWMKIQLKLLPCVVHRRHFSSRGAWPHWTRRKRVGTSRPWRRARMAKMMRSRRSRRRTIPRGST